MSAEREVRSLTGLPSWPMGLLTGPEKVGKTYHAVRAAASPLIGDTYWLAVGEDVPDEYGALDGVDRIKVVPHDGTRRDILAAAQWIARQPKVDGKPNLTVLDSATKVWDLICSDLQEEANVRARKKAEKYHREVSDEDQSITMDLWNIGKQRWTYILDTLAENDGPVLLTARQDIVTVVDAQGNPTKEKDRKIKAEKTLAFEVGFIVEFPAMGEAILTGVRSLKVKAAGTKRTEVKDFTVDQLWHDLGLAEKVTPRDRSAIANERRSVVDGLLARIEASDVTLDQLRAIWHEAKAADLLAEHVDDKGTTVANAIDVRGAEVQYRIDQEAAEQHEQERGA